MRSLFTLFSRSAVAVLILSALLAASAPAQASAPDTAISLTTAPMVPPVSLVDARVPAVEFVTDLDATLRETVFTAHQELTMVRAKFKVMSITRTEQTTYPHLTADGKVDYTRPVMKEMHTIKANPVYGNGDPTHENTKFWQASPSGSIELGTVNADAVAQMKLGAEMYVDFTPADG